MFLSVILIGKTSNFFLHYSAETNKILNTAMFTLIGIAYLVFAFAWKKKLLNLIFIVCGLYLIGMNFIDDFELKSIIGIVCILLPMLITRFLSNEINKYSNGKFL